MPSKDGRTPPYCSERMKTCQKHLSKVYSRSKHLLTTSRAGKVVPEVTESAARGFADGGANQGDGPGISPFEKRNLSPYLRAVAGLFDGPSLLKQFQLRNLCGGLADKSLKGQSKADCPTSCSKGFNTDSKPVPVFFQDNPVGPAPTGTAIKHATNTETGRGIVSRKPRDDAAPPVRNSSKANLGRRLNGDVHQTTSESALSVVPKEKLGNNGSSPDLPSNHRINDSGKLKITSQPSNITSDQTAIPNSVVPQNSRAKVPHQKAPSYKSARKPPQLLAGSEAPKKQISTSNSQRDLPDYNSLKVSAGNGSTVPMQKAHTKRGRNTPPVPSSADSQQRLVYTKSGRKDLQLPAGMDSQQRASLKSSKRPPKIPEAESQLMATPSSSGRPFSKPLPENDKPLKGSSIPIDPQSSTFQGRLKKVSSSVNILQASVAKVFGAAVGPPKPLKQTLTISQLHDAICDHSTPDCPSFRRKDRPGAIPKISSATLGQPRLEQEGPEPPQVDTSDDEDKPLSRREIANAHDKSAQIAFEVKTNKRRQAKSSANLWKYGNMAVCTEHPGRDYTTGESPPDTLHQLIEKKPEISEFHWSKSGSHKVVNHVCQILKQNQWGAGVVELLESVKGMINTHCVNAILQQQKVPHTCLRFFKWAQSQKGYKHDVFAFTTMINILGRARNMRGVRHLLEDMHTGGIEPNVATYNTLILCYGKVESLSESMRVFRIMQEAGCKPDNVTYSILIHLCIKAGYLDEALKLYQAMLEAGVQPDTITYSIVIDSIGKSGKLKEARKLFREMRERGCSPNEFTYNSMINRHAKARKTLHALKYYTEMRSAGFRLNAVTCTTMMGVLGSLGKLDQAESLFSEMQQAGIVPDTAAYSLMINMWGNSGHLEKAVSWYGKMLGNLVTPSLSVFSSLVNAHLEANLYQSTQHFLTSMGMWGINSDLKLYTILLRHCTLCEKQEHADAVLGIMDRLGHPAHRFLYDLITASSQDRGSIRSRVISYFNSADNEDNENKQGFANALVEFLHKLQCKTDPSVVWETCTEKGIFSSTIVRREAPNHWLIDLHSLSVRTALVALPRLLETMRDKWVQIPTKRVYIVTGWGKRSRVAGTSALKLAVRDVLDAIKSPFSLDHANAGVFVSYGPPFCDWMSEPSIVKKLDAIASDGVVK